MVSITPEMRENPSRTSVGCITEHSQPVLKKLVSSKIAKAVFSAVCLLRETNLDHVERSFNKKNKQQKYFVVIFAMAPFTGWAKQWPRKCRDAWARFISNRGPWMKHTFSAFWLRSSVVSVLISLISRRLINLILRFKFFKKIDFKV